MHTNNLESQLVSLKKSYQNMILNFWRLINPCLFSVVLIVLLTSCTGKLKPLQILVDAPEIQEIKPSQPDALIMRPVKWSVIVNNGDASICLGVKHYENLAKNTTDIVKYLKQQNALIEYLVRQKE